MNNDNKLSITVAEDKVQPNKRETKNSGGNNTVIIICIVVAIIVLALAVFGISKTRKLKRESNDNSGIISSEITEITSDSGSIEIPEIQSDSFGSTSDSSTDEKSNDSVWESVDSYSYNSKTDIKDSTSKAYSSVETTTVRPRTTTRRVSVIVSNVVGLSESLAVATLENQNFIVKVQREYSDTVSKGTVIRQSPNAGSLGYAGDTVTIVVSEGQDPVISSINEKYAEKYSSLFAEDPISYNSPSVSKYY